ncbi:hypothetical protein GCM10027075_51670 [Streptomyces heilongjiangensis]
MAGSDASRRTARSVTVPAVPSSGADRLLADNGGGMYAVPGARVRTTPEPDFGSGRACARVGFPLRASIPL